MHRPNPDFPNDAPAEAHSINILGTVYDILCFDLSDDPRMKDCSGLCDGTVHEICVDNFASEKSGLAVKDLPALSRKVMRHEILHAFLFESGLAENSDWAQNEEIVDWFAIQGPKIIQAWKEAGAL